jgi:RecB family exonuclease
VPVTIPGTGFNIKGYIDRLDIAADGKQALVRDYKTGKAPKEDALLDGGRELQRCLYAFAVKALLGEDVAINASLLFPREQRELRLDDPDASLAEISRYLRAARTTLADGAALIGPDAGGEYDELAFALPANASANYCKRKHSATIERFGELAQLWGADE